MAQHFGSFGENLVRKETIPASPKTEDEIVPFLSQKERVRMEAGGTREVAPKDFNVWIVETEMSQDRRKQPGHEVPLPTCVPPKSSDETKDPRERFVSVRTMPQREVRKELPYLYIKRGEVSPNMIPDLVIVAGGVGYVDNDEPREFGGSLVQQYLKYETNVIREIRAAADSALYFPDIETGDPIRDGTAYEFLNINILGTEFVQNQFEPHESITDAMVLDTICSGLFNTEADEEISARAFDEYARTGDEEILRKVVTAGRVRRAAEQECRYSPEWFLKSLRDREVIIPENKKFQNSEAAVQYHKDMTDRAKLLVASTTPAELQKKVFEALKNLVDMHKGEYLNDVEASAAERKILQPLIVATGPSELFLNAALEAGADAVLREMSPGDMQKLIRLANAIRTSPASISTDRLRRNKSEFYKSLGAELEDRSEQTADTEQELALLKSLFEKSGAKKVLDVGSGWGRLALPLIESGYDVTGLEANRNYREKAKKSAGKNRRAHFKKGDIIHYEDAVKRGEYDGVYYGWHSFLEAYGLGNSLETLRSARLVLKPGGVLTFDQPSRENPGFEDGWYGDDKRGYLAYLMSEDELRFILRLAGFEDVEIIPWTTKPSELYPEGMKKISVTAKKPMFGLPTEPFGRKEKAPST